MLIAKDAAAPAEGRSRGRATTHTPQGGVLIVKRGHTIGSGGVGQTTRKRPCIQAPGNVQIPSIGICRASV